MHDATLIATLAIGFVLAFALGFVAHRLRLPPLVDGERVIAAQLKRDEGAPPTAEAPSGQQSLFGATAAKGAPPARTDSVEVSARFGRSSAPIALVVCSWARTRASASG